MQRTVCIWKSSLAPSAVDGRGIGTWRGVGEEDAQRDDRVCYKEMRPFHAPKEGMEGEDVARSEEY